MATQFFINTFYLQWFRAFQQPHHFRFDKQRNLGIFAPNGTGKSSIGDGLEFVLSAEGTLARLGNVNDYRLNKAGPDALKNIFAKGKKKESIVGIEIARDVKEPKPFGSTRVIGNKKYSESKNFKNFLNELNVSPIIRGMNLSHL